MQLVSIIDYNQNKVSNSHPVINQKHSQTRVEPEINLANNKSQ